MRKWRCSSEVYPTIGRVADPAIWFRAGNPLSMQLAVFHMASLPMFGFMNVTFRFVTSASGPFKQKGSALVITLAFITLLSALVVAFLVRAGFERQVSQLSLRDAQSDILARSALNI